MQSSVPVPQLTAHAFRVHDRIRNRKNIMGSHVWISPYIELHAPLRMSSRWAPDKTDEDIWIKCFTNSTIVS